MKHVRLLYLYFRILIKYGFRLVDLFWFGETVNSSKSELYYNMGTFYLIEKKQIDKAISYYKKSIELNPDFGYPHAGLASALLINKYPDKALEYINKAIDLLPRIVRFQAIQFMIFRALGNQQMMNKSFESYCHLLSGDKAESYEHLAYIYFQFENYREAEFYHKKAIEESPDRVLFHYNLGVTYYSQNKYTEAKEAFEKVVLVKKDNKYMRQAKGYLKDIDYFNAKRHESSI